MRINDSMLKMIAVNEQTRRMIEVSYQHSSLLSVLREGPRRQVDLVERLEKSRRSISRALDRLEDRDLVQQQDERWGLTVAGSSTLELVEQQAGAWSMLTEASDLLAKLPSTTPIGCEMLADVDVISGLEAAPQAAFGPIEESIRAADHVQGFSPIVADRYVRVVHDEIVNQGTEMELVLPKCAIFAAIDQYGLEWTDSLAAANCEIWRTEHCPDIGMVICDSEEIFVGIYENGGLAGTLRNDTKEAIEWGEMIFNCCRARAVRVLPPTDADL